jgi:hypothetical protein
MGATFSVHAMVISSRAKRQHGAKQLQLLLA